MIQTSLILPLVLIASLAFGSRALERTWFAPGAFFALYWMFTCSLAFGSQELSITSSGMWWIGLGICLFCLGSSFGTGSLRGRLSHPSPLECEVLLPRLKPLIAICVILGLTYIYFVLTYFSIDKTPLFMQVILPSVYIAPTLGGMLFAGARSWKDRSIGLAGVIPEILLCFAFSGRSGLVTVFAFWFSGFFCVQLLMKGTAVALFTRQKITAVLALIFGLFVPGVVILQLLRQVYTPGSLGISGLLSLYKESVRWETYPEAWAYMRHAFFGQVVAFSTWFDMAWADPPIPSPAFLFAGPLTLLGLYDRDGTPMESVEVEAGVPTNVYTPFRPLIDAFSFPGSLLVLFLLGLLMGWAFRRTKERSWKALSVLIIFYADTLIGGCIMFRYNSFILTYAAIAFYIFFGKPSVKADTEAGAVRRASESAA